MKPTRRQVLTGMAAAPVAVAAGKADAVQVVSPLKGRVFNWVTAYGDFVRKGAGRGVAKNGTHARWRCWQDPGSGPVSFGLVFRYKRTSHPSERRKFAAIIRESKPGESRSQKWLEAITRLERAADKSLLMLDLYGEAEHDSVVKSGETPLQTLERWDAWKRENHWA